MRYFSTFFASMALMAALSGALVPGDASAQEQNIFGNRPPAAPYLAPGRLFRVQMAGDWQLGPNPGKNDTVEFTTQRNGQGSAIWRFHRRPVASGARAKQLMLYALEQRKEHLPHLRNVNIGERMVGGLKAAMFTGEFWWQGNAQYPRVVEEIFVVLGQDAYELHLEAFPVLFQATVEEREAMLQSFVPRPGADAPAVDDEEDEIKFDNLPF